MTNFEPVIMDNSSTQSPLDSIQASPAIGSFRGDSEANVYELCSQSAGKVYLPRKQEYLEVQIEHDIANAVAAREALLATALPKDSKDFKMMVKSGFETSGSLGVATNQNARATPLEASREEDGVGMNAEEKRAICEEMEGGTKKIKADEPDHSEQIVKEREGSRVEGIVAEAPKVFEKLEMEEGEEEAVGKVILCRQIGEDPFELTAAKKMSVSKSFGPPVVESSLESKELLVSPIDLKPMEEHLSELPKKSKEHSLSSSLPKNATPLPVEDLLGLARSNPHGMSFVDTARASDESVVAGNEEPELTLETDGRYFTNEEPSAWFRSLIDSLKDQSTTDFEPEKSDEEKANHAEQVGSECRTKTLYEGPADCKCCVNWVEEYPDNLREKIENSGSLKRYALLIRLVKGHGTNRKLKLHSVKIQSVLIRRTLAEVFEDYPGITPELEDLTFNSPFRPFFYRRRELEEATKRQSKDPEVTSHLHLLYSSIADELSEIFNIQESLISHNVVTFEYIWTLFPPGELVFTVVQGQDRVVQITDEPKLIEKEGIWCLSCRYIDWNGKWFGWNTKKLDIAAFDGSKPILELEAYPFSFHASPTKIRQKLIQRGEKFASLQGFHYKSYTGIAQQLNPMNAIFGGSGKKKIDGRVVIDAAMFGDVNYGLDLEPLKMAQDPDSELKHISGIRSSEDASLPSDLAKSTEPVKQSLSYEELLLCNSTVKGYSLSSKEWVILYVDNVDNIVWSEHAYSSLILPGTRKEILLSLVKSQRRKSGSFDDVMEGKGQGIIILLEGPPGVGKTLTAEAIAEHLRVPLYSVSAGELGHKASKVEDSFNSIFTLVTKWNAVLLFDEADVFLEERTIDNIERNKLVAVLLRMLEYYRGIMFLTTNKVKSFDPAFESRIHLTLKFPELDAASRKAIWANFVKLSPKEVEITEEELDSLAETVMNGRQIKNVFKIGFLLAGSQNLPLNIEHIRNALQMTYGNF